MKDRVTQRVQEKVDDETEEALDRVECAATDERCIEEAEAAGKEVDLVERPTAAPEDTATGNADLRLLIEGHTDNVGDAAANQVLSEKRAAAVKAHLVSAFKIEAARLESKGFGASRPAEPNDTPEGRQQNRRVELVKR